MLHFANSLHGQNLAQLRKNNLRAYLVHFGGTQTPKVFITRCKERETNLDGSLPLDIYAKPRQCGGRHTILQQCIRPGGNYGTASCTPKVTCLRDLFQMEEFVAAGTLKRDEKTIHGADGKPYRGRNDVIQFDQELTIAIQSSDPIKVVTEEMKKAGAEQLDQTLSSPRDMKKNLMVSADMSALPLID